MENISKLSIVTQKEISIDFPSDTSIRHLNMPNMKFIHLFIIPLHILNIVSIVVNEKLHQQNVYVVLVNLSLSDSALLLGATLAKQLSLISHLAIRIALRMFHAASIVFTCSITLERYLSFLFSILFLFMFFFALINLGDKIKGRCSITIWSIHRQCLSDVNGSNRC